MLLVKLENLWNCDKSGIPSDPKKVKVVSVRGKTAYRMTVTEFPSMGHHHWSVNRNIPKRKQMGFSRLLQN